MTIRRRLFLSNMLMLVIPVAASMLVAYSILFVFTRSSHDPMEQAFPKAFDIVLRFQQSGDAQRLLTDVAAFNAAHADDPLLIAVERDGALLEPAEVPDRLRALDGGAMFGAVLDSGVTGSVSVNDMRLVVERAGAYRVIIADLGRGGFGPKRSALPRVYYPLLILATLAVVVAATNRLLTHMVAGSITRSLDILVNGVHQLRDGNLDYRLDYARKDEFAPVCADFNEMAERLQELIRSRQRDEASRKELLAGISHDLRTPLTSVKAYVEGLLDGVAEDYPTQLKYLGIIRQKAEDIDQIVDKLFLFSKLEIEEYPFHPEPLDIGAALAELTAEAAEEYAARGLDIAAGQLPGGITVSADPAQLRNAVLNIAENSLKYKDKDRGSLTVSCARKGDAVEIALEDDGPGVPEESLDKLFDVFYRADPARRNPGGGSGLGLAITGRILERMGGSVRAENRAGGGLRITMTMPVEPDGGRTRP